jgi:hypothetical protein
VATCPNGVENCVGGAVPGVRAWHGDDEARKEAGRRRVLRQLCDACASDQRAICVLPKQRDPE